MLLDITNSTANEQANNVLKVFVSLLFTHYQRLNDNNNPETFTNIMESALIFKSF